MEKKDEGRLSFLADMHTSEDVVNAVKELLKQVAHKNISPKEARLYSEVLATTFLLFESYKYSKALHSKFDELKILHHEFMASVGKEYTV